MSVATYRCSNSINRCVDFTVSFSAAANYRVKYFFLLSNELPRREGPVYLPTGVRSDYTFTHGLVLGARRTRHDRAYHPIHVYIDTVVSLGVFTPESCDKKGRGVLGEGIRAGGFGYNAI